MVGLARLLVPDRETAEDLAQEAFIRFASRNAELAVDEQRPYLRRTLINLTHSYWRRRAVAARFARPQAEAGHDQTSDAGVLRADQQRIVDAVRSLPRRQQECVALRYYSELSDQEIAALLRLSPSSVKTSLRRAKAALAERLGGTGDE